MSIKLILSAGILLSMIGMTENKPAKYVYADGSGNTFILSASGETTIEYEPVQPKFSSSGFYSGGKYVKKNITRAQYDAVAGMLDDAASKKEIHIKDRVMGSGMIQIEGGNAAGEYILNPNSAEKNNIEKTLKELIKGD